MNITTLAEYCLKGVIKDFKPFKANLQIYDYFPTRIILEKEVNIVACIKGKEMHYGFNKKLFILYKDLFKDNYQEFNDENVRVILVLPNNDIVDYGEHDLSDGYSIEMNSVWKKCR